MANQNRNKRNQPPTGEGKKQSPGEGRARKLNKRSEVLQATSAEQNVGTSADESDFRSASSSRAKAARPKAGR
jgi:hypothetical protein